MKETAAKEASRFPRFRKLFTSSSSSLASRDLQIKQLFVLLSFFLYYFADSSIYRRGCPCSAFGNLSPCVFHERREDRWRDVGGNWIAVVLHHAGDINHFFCLEDRTWKPRNPGETNKVWHCFCLCIKTSRSAKLTLLNGDTSWYLTLSRIWISQ